MHNINMTKVYRHIQPQNPDTVDTGTTPVARRVARHDEDMHIDTMARTVWGEARSEGFQGMHAVACVIINRYNIAKRHGTYWWGDTITDICKKPYQFSCWNANDPNRIKLNTVTTDDPEFRSAKRIAGRIVRGQKYDDVTNGADHYHTYRVHPNWQDGTKISAEIGSHIFYKLID